VIFPSMTSIDATPPEPTSLWLRLVRSESVFLPWSVALVNLILMLFTEFVTLHHYPNSGDEYAYQISASLFSEGKLSVPSPRFPRFFDVVHVVNDGRFYGKYPPGWPAWLAVGTFLVIPWLVNPIFGTGTLFAIRLMARRVLGREGANLSTLLLLANPFLIFTSASYFSHSSCLFFIATFFLFLFEGVDEPQSVRPFVGLGCSAGMAFMIRPFTTIVLLALPTAYLLAQLRLPHHRQAILRGLGASLLPFLGCLCLFLAYNKMQTGNLFLQPFQKYDPLDVPGLPANSSEWSERIRTHVLLRLWDLNRWLPLSVFFLVVAGWERETRGNPRVHVLLGSFLSLFVAFFCYWGDGIVQYGPRYLYEALGSLVVLAASVLKAWQGRGTIAAAAIVTLGAATFIQASFEYSSVIQQKRDVFRMVEEARLSNALVFLKTGSGTAPAYDCSRNGTKFSGPVLFVRDMGLDNAILRREYPDREAYEYEYDRKGGRGRLSRLEPLPGGSR